MPPPKKRCKLVMPPKAASAKQPEAPEEAPEDQCVVTQQLCCFLGDMDGTLDLIEEVSAGQKSSWCKTIREGLKSCAAQCTRARTNDEVLVTKNDVKAVFGCEDHMREARRQIWSSKMHLHALRNHQSGPVQCLLPPVSSQDRVDC